jgi:hypothetical protein
MLLASNAGNWESPKETSRVIILETFPNYLSSDRLFLLNIITNPINFKYIYEHFLTKDTMSWSNVSMTFRF